MCVCVCVHTYGNRGDSVFSDDDIAYISIASVVFFVFLITLFSNKSHGYVGNNYTILGIDELRSKLIIEHYLLQKLR